MVLERFRSLYKLPSTEEGYDRIMSLKSSEHTSVEYNLADVNAILERLQGSMPPPSSGHSFRNFRGRGNWRGTGRGTLSSTRGSGVEHNFSNVGGRGNRAVRGRGIVSAAGEENWRNNGRAPSS